MNFGGLSQTGFNIAGDYDLPDLFKALQAGYQYHVTDQTGGGALRVESLESSLKVLTYTEKNVRFWQKIPKMPAYNTVEEYNQLAAYGDNSNAFIPEGILPETQDTVYQRQVALVKYLGTTAVITHQQTLVRAAHGDVRTLENKNRILWLLRQIERNLFWGNNKLVNGFNSNPTYSGPAPVEGIEWAGLDTQIVASNIIDAKGASLTEGLMEDASELIAENYGQVTDIYCPYKVASDFSKSMYPKERVFLPSPDGGIQAGTVVNTFNSQFGPVQVNADVFLTKHRKAISTAPSAASSVQAPATPASVSGSVTSGAGVWKSLGTSYYVVTAVNRFGESAASAASSGVAISSAADVVTLTITNPSSVGGLVPDYFNVYRSDLSASGPFWYIDSVAAASQANNGTTTYTDTGLYMTNVSTSFIGQLDPMVVAFKQLAPLMKMDIAVLGPAIRWMILLYGTGPVLYAPAKWVKIINIGDLS